MDRIRNLLIEMQHRSGLRCHVLPVMILIQRGRTDEEIINLYMQHVYNTSRHFNWLWD